MATGRKPKESLQVRKLREALAREKAKSAALAKERADAREQQAAAAAILKVISRSPSDAQPVFDAIVKRAIRLMRGHSAVVTRIADGIAYLGAFTSTSKAGDEVIRKGYPRPIDRKTATGRAIRYRRPSFTSDLQKQPGSERSKSVARKRGYRSLLSVPMLRDGMVIGTLNVTRKEPGPFGKHEIELLQTFAEQAVIAIENVRRFNETKEALERQTATAEILKVINRSPTDLQPVFDEMCAAAARLCGANDTAIQLVERSRLRVGGHHGPIPTEDLPMVRGTVAARAALDRKAVHILDLQSERKEFPEGSDVAGRLGIRTVLSVPLLREGQAIGVIVARRTEARYFTDRQVELLRTFADQAVIAIESVRLFNETKEALERQKATAEILQVIASSPSDVQPVFDAIVRKARELVRGHSAAVFRVTDDVLHYAASTSTSKAGDEALRRDFPMALSRMGLSQIVVRTRAPHTVADLEKDPSARSKLRELARARGFRSWLGVPLVQDGNVIGLITVTRREIGKFGDHEIGLLQTFADQAVIAIENARLFNETKESLERQTATAEILKVIASSPSDVQPVFEEIARHAFALCGSAGANVFRYDGKLMHHAASHQLDPAFVELVKRGYPRPPDRSRGVGRAILTRSEVFIEDGAADRHYDKSLTTPAGFRRVFAVPMLRDGEPIGAIAVIWQEPGPVAQHQRSLLRTFADQAVIAIENVRLFNETKEALEQQTAISEVLRVISSSPADVQPVLEAVAVRAAKICDASDARIALVEGDHIRHAAGFGDLPPTREIIPLGRGAPIGRAVIDRATVYIQDIQAETDEDLALAREIAASSGWRSNLVVPLMRKDRAVGAIALRRRDVRPFTPKQISLLQTFADQAAIAIENVRLFNETKEALEQQTAISEILRVMSDSPSDVGPVLDAVAERALQICGSADARIFVVDGEELSYATGRGAVESVAHGTRRPINRGSVMGRAVIDRAPVHVEDLAAVSESEFPLGREIQRQFGHRTTLGIPLLREGKALGVIILRRKEVRPFTEKQITLLKTFSDQAAIAIENVRLFNETNEALERQTATSDILRVISSSPSDLTPVFDAILENATRLCDAHLGVLNLNEGTHLKTAAHRGFGPEFTKWLDERGAFTPSELMANILTSRVPVQFADLRELETYRTGSGSTRAFVELGGARSSLSVPLVKADQVLGFIAIYRPEVRPFTDKQVDLVKAFSAQAVIAMENVRLFNETKDALERQTATADVLRAISTSPTDTRPVFDAILERAAKLCGAENGILFRYSDDAFHALATRIPNPEFAALFREPRRPPPGSRNGLARVRDSKRVVHIPDMLSDSATLENDPLRVQTVKGGMRSWLGVPLLKEGELTGAIAIYRSEPLPFSPPQIALLETFAEQAVIAVENVRLFNETKEALERQTATGEILKVIASSPSNVQPVFDAIVQSAGRLFDPCDAGLWMVEGDQLFHRALAKSKKSPGGVDIAALNRLFPRPIASSFTFGLAIAKRRVVEMQETEVPGAPADALEISRALGTRSAVFVPLLREDTAIGLIALASPYPGMKLAPEQIALLKTFADQAVIAIENVRLFNETKESLERQTATGEILKVIASSPSDVRPVFDAIVHSVSRLFGRKAALRTVESEGLRRRARSYEPSPEEFHGPEVEPLDEKSIVGQAILGGRALQWADTLVEGAATYGMEKARSLAFRSIASAPLIRDRKAIGVISVSSPEPGTLSDKQMELLSTFADQAVIAIENVRLFNETKEALERQTATAEVLKVISGSMADTQPVFDTIAVRAARLTGATFGWVFTLDGGLIHATSSFGLNPQAVEVARKAFPMPPSGGSYTARAIRDGQIFNVADALAETDPEYLTKPVAAAAGYRSVLAVPMFRDRHVAGAIVVNRAEPGRFADKEVELLKTFADQAVIAIENVRLFNETKESLERQTATAEILKVIASSPSDVQPVFDAIAASARRLLDGGAALVNRRIGDMLELAAFTSTGEAGDAALKKLFPAKLTGKGHMGKAILTAAPVLISDIQAEQDYSEAFKADARTRGVRSIVSVPMMKDGEAIGGISVNRPVAGNFTEHQTNLLKTFADQAVIAIENVRLFNETKEALERQTATAEILRVIGESMTDTQPVFDAIVKNCRSLFPGSGVVLRLVENGMLTARAGVGSAPRPEERRLGAVPLDDKSAPGACVVGGRIVHLPDLEAAVDRFPLLRNMGLRMGYRSGLYAPLMREGGAIGALTVLRPEVGAFSEKDVALLTTFADQAVIAIENVRLFNETKESLERQTATAEILKVIASSPSDVQPVFDAIVRSAAKLFDPWVATITIVEGDHMHWKATAAAHEADLVFEQTKSIYPLPFDPQRSPSARAVLERKIVELLDTSAPDTPEFTQRARQVSGFRAITYVPLTREHQGIGVIILASPHAGSKLTEKQLELVQTFADQAVIAIENVRLFNETKETLERQTATAEILKVISSSPTDVEPVFAAIVRKAVQLSGANRGALYRLEGEVLDLVAHHNQSPEALQALQSVYPMKPDRTQASGRAVLGRAVVEVPDVRNDTEYLPGLAAQADLGSLLAVPMLRADGTPSGVIVIQRPESGTFAPRHIELLKTFADQAVIAIENVRLFKELEERTSALGKSVEKLTALGEVGQAISSTLDLEAVLKKIATHAVRLTGLDNASIYEYDEANEAFRLQAADSVDDELLETVRRYPIRKGDGTVGGVAMTRQPAQVPDILDEGYRSTRKDLLIRAGYRAVLTVPLLHEEHIIGALSVSRKTPGRFADEVVALMKTFATQSAMAIQNARLFREIEEKGKQLEEASKHKSQFLASMSHELRTPLNAILGFNEMILGDVYGEVPADMKEPLSDIQTSGKHLLRLINNVLDLAKIEAGRMELALDDYSVHDTVESVRSTLRPLAEAKGLELAVDVPNDLPLARGDGGRITQCLMNLAGNSLKFTKQGSVGISVALTNGTLTYRVKDTGIGIPANKIDSLFTEFKQTDATIASEYGGTGLGLSITKKFIEMHGGRIWAESEPGNGSTFTFEVPLRTEEAKEA